MRQRSEWTQRLVVDPMASRKAEVSQRTRATRKGVEITVPFFVCST